MDVFLGEIGEGSSVTLATAPWLSFRASSVLCLQLGSIAQMLGTLFDLRVACSFVSMDGVRSAAFLQNPGLISFSA